MAKQRGTRGGQGNTVTLRHPIAGEKKLTETQYKILKAAADNSETRSANLRKLVGYATGAIDNAFTQIFSEFEVSSRLAAIIWFNEAEVVSADSELGGFELEQPVVVADRHENLLTNVREWQQRFTYILTTTTIVVGGIIFGYIFWFNARHTPMNAWSNFYSIVPLMGGCMGL